MPQGGYRKPPARLVVMTHNIRGFILGLLHKNGLTAKLIIDYKKYQSRTESGFGDGKGNYSGYNSMWLACGDNYSDNDCDGTYS